MQTSVYHSCFHLLTAEGDALQFADGAFTAVIDKGALDALASDESEDADAAVEQYLQEMQRVLDRRAGVFLCVTLAQAHTLRNVPCIPLTQLSGIGSVKLLLGQG